MLDGPPRRLTRPWHERLAWPCAPAGFGPGPIHPDQPLRPEPRSPPARSDPPTAAPSHPDPRYAHPQDQPVRHRCSVTLAHDLRAPPNTRTTWPVPAPTSQAESLSTTHPKQHSKPCRDPIAIPKRPGGASAPGLPLPSPLRFGRDRGILECGRNSRLRSARPHSAPSRSYLTPGAGRGRTPLHAFCWPCCWPCAWLSRPLLFPPCGQAEHRFTFGRGKGRASHDRCGHLPPSPPLGGAVSEIPGLDSPPCPPLVGHAAGRLSLAGVSAWGSSHQVGVRGSSWLTAARKHRAPPFAATFVGALISSFVRPPRQRRAAARSGDLTPPPGPPSGGARPLPLVLGEIFPPNSLRFSLALQGVGGVLGALLAQFAQVRVSSHIVVAVLGPAALTPHAADLPTTLVRSPAAVLPPPAVALPFTLSGSPDVWKLEGERPVRRCRWCGYPSQAPVGSSASLSSQLQALPPWSAGGTSLYRSAAILPRRHHGRGGNRQPRGAARPRARNARRLSDRCPWCRPFRLCVAGVQTPHASQDLRVDAPPSPLGGCRVPPARGSTPAPSAVRHCARPATQASPAAACAGPLRSLAPSGRQGWGSRANPARTRLVPAWSGWGRPVLSGPRTNDVRRPGPEELHSPSCLPPGGAVWHFDPPLPPVGGSKVPSLGALAALTSLRFGQLRRPAPSGPNRPWRYGPASLPARQASPAPVQRHRCCPASFQSAVAHFGLVGAESRGSRPRVRRRCFQPAPRAASQRWRSAHCLGLHRSHLLAFLPSETTQVHGNQTN